MKNTEVKYDCLHYRGDIPCAPNKLRGKICPGCDEYAKISKRILLIKLGAMGDVIRTTPLLKKLREVHPGSHITWLTHYPDILPELQIDSIQKFGYSTVFCITNERYDIAINLDKDKEACILLSKVQAKEKFGFSWSDEGHITGLSEAAESKILTGLFDELSRSNKSSYQEEIFEICGFKFNKEPNILNVDEMFAAKWKAYFKNERHGSLIGLNTGCGNRWPTRLWPREYWITLISKLMDSGYTPVLLGGEDEHDANLKYSEITGALYPGHHSLKEFIAIVDECDIVVTAVSMAMHIASGLGKPIVLFNNIFNRHEFELYEKGVIVEPSTGCDCYYGNVCKRQVVCMNDIKPETVLGHIRKMAPMNG